MSGQDRRDAHIFSVYMRTNDNLARDERSKISLATLKHAPLLREAVDDDVQALAKAACEARGWADIYDLTRAGYSQDVALHFVDRLTIGRTSASPRFSDQTINQEGEAA